MSNRTSWVLTAAVLLFGGLVSAATPQAAGPGRILAAPSGRGVVEELRLEPGLAAALSSVPVDASVTVPSWPVAPGVREDVLVTRHEIYSEDARIVVVEGGREVELPRSRLVFLWGHATDDESISVIISVDPDTDTVSGSSMSALGNYDLHGPSEGHSLHLLTPEGAQEEGVSGFACGLEELSGEHSGQQKVARLGVSKALASMHTAVIAFDTDNELLSLKFSNNTTTATNYIAQLVAGLNAIYERDLFVRLLQGYTILRVSTTPDPYVATTTGNANSTQLNEVSSYWGANYAGIRKALVVMLSGKQVGGGWSGIAWVGGLCSSSYGVSFNQVSRSGTTAGNGDFQLVGHEMGHNFGSPHTHCTDTDAATSGTQPIDFCNTSQCGTSWNPPSGAVCPTAFTVNPLNGSAIANVRGTLMSYCHQLSGCSLTNVFHPLTVSLTVSPDVDAAVGQCIFPVTANPPPTVSSITPASGLSTGGTAVTIEGGNFRSPATVSFVDLAGAKIATSVVVVSGTRITATTPAHTGGVKNVVVQNPEGAGATLPNAFTYIPVPVLTSIQPNTGPTTGGTPVTISGANFVSPATVSLGGAAATSVSVVNASTITATTPAHAAGLVDLVVQSNAVTATLAGAFQYGDPPPGRRFFSLPPCRILDTRNAAGPLGGPALTASGGRQFSLANVCGIPTTAQAVSVNVTVTGATAAGFLTLYPGGTSAPVTSNINFSSGQTRANNAVILLGAGGTGPVAVQNGSTSPAHLILDVNGYFE